MPNSADNRRLGKQVAELLSRSWADDSQQPAIEQRELAAITPLLLAAGSAGLAWRQLRRSDLRTSLCASEFQQAYRETALSAAVSEQRIARALAMLRSAGIEPVLVKGWAIARLYLEPGLRPYGDLDLCVRPSDYTASAAVLDNPEARDFLVDLHKGFERLDEGRFEELYARSRLVELGDTRVRVLAPEDHFRLMAVHMLRHGAARPLWLCDIAVALESRASDFNWEACLGSNPRTADWIACVIGLAKRLLGARIDDTPVASRAGTLPTWLIDAVLRQWGVIYAVRLPIAIYWKRSSGVLSELRHHWPNAVEATANLKGPFNNLPRLPYQLCYSSLRAVRFLAGVTRAGGQMVNK